MPDTVVKHALTHYQLPGELKAIHPFKVGHINETFVSIWSEGGQKKRYLHQKVNSYVFKDVPAVMENIERVIGHIRRKRGLNTRETLSIVPTSDGCSFVQNGGGDYWRTYEFIENTVGFEICSEPRQAYEAAKVLGRFLVYLSDCRPSDFHYTIPLFQNVPNRFIQLDEAISGEREGRTVEAKSEIDFAMSRRSGAGIIEALLEDGKIPLRVTHGDPKFNNVLFQAVEGAVNGDVNGTRSYGDGLAVVDLDTVMPGTMLFDFGDLARSVVVASREDEVDLSLVKIKEELFGELVRGYLESTSGVLTVDEINHMHIAPRILALSLGVRFLTDFLAGDQYFKIDHLNHNLERARAQFKVVLEMERAEERMREIVQKHAA